MKNQTIIGIVSLVFTSMALAVDSESVLTSSPTPKKKIIVVDYVNTQTVSMGSDCPTNTIAVGVAHMPENASYYTFTSVSRNDYVTNVTKNCPSPSSVTCPGGCLDWVTYSEWNYTSYTPKWVSGFSTPQIICSPVSIQWN